MYLMWILQNVFKTLSSLVHGLFIYGIERFSFNLNNLVYIISSWIKHHSIPTYVNWLCSFFLLVRTYYFISIEWPCTKCTTCPLWFLYCVAQLSIPHLLCLWNGHCLKICYSDIWPRECIYFCVRVSVLINLLIFRPAILFWFLKRSPTLRMDYNLSPEALYFLLDNMSLWNLNKLNKLSTCDLRFSVSFQSFRKHFCWNKPFVSTNLSVVL